MIKNKLFSAGFITAFLSFGTAMNAQCTPLSEFTENFDALFCCDMGIVPPCWNSIITPGGGNQIISNTSPASAPRNVYQTGYGKISIVIMPALTNINAGTHHFKFKARVNPGSTPGLLDFGYITDINDVNSFVVLQSITISNGTYDSSSERILDVPTTVPANARLAIRNPGTTWVGHYWDDAVWEPKSNLSTGEIINNKPLTISPNPAKDFISLSTVKNIIRLKITDTAGRIARNIENPTSSINIKDLEKGIYFITLQYKDGKTETVKLLKQ